MWVWLCSWWLLPRLARERAQGGRHGPVAHDGPIGPDPARSPRISTALTHYWRELGVAAMAEGLDATVELAQEVVAALRVRFPDRPDALPSYPALRTLP